MSLITRLANELQDRNRIMGIQGIFQMNGNIDAPDRIGEVNYRKMNNTYREPKRLNRIDTE
jgi:hypothetical protein